MSRLLDPEGPAMSLITRLVYSAYLNILWMICCIPIVTIGASTTALYQMTLKMAKNEEGRLTSGFFNAFKENFRQSTIVWLILLALGILLGVDGYVFYHMRFENVFWAVGTAAFLVLIVGYCIILLWVFPILSRFENTTFQTIKNALMVGMRFLFCTALAAAIHFAMLVVIINVFLPVIVFGEGTCAFLCSFLMNNVLGQLETKASNYEETRHNDEE